MKLADLQGQRLGILGMGLEGKAAYRWLRRRLQQLPLTLMAESPPDPSFVDSLGGLDTMVIGPLSEAGLHSFDVLVRSPGISPYRAALTNARDQGVQIISPGSLWFTANPAAKTICISGTKGKSTTASLIAHILRCQGLKVRLAGNIGRPLLAFDPDSESVDWWVVELSSYQLADLKGHAAVGVLLNLDQDHLDWHGGVDSYYQDKLNLVGLLRAGDVLIANHADSILRERLINLDHEMAVTWFNNAGGFRIQNGEILEGGEALAVASTEALPGSLPGPHNLANLAAALTVLKTLDVDPINAVRAAASYKGLPHRLQLVGQRDGVRYVNDSIASAPLATVAAVEAFPDIRATLIVGGMDRGVDWSPHIKAIARMRPAGIIGMPDNGQSLLTMFSESGLVPEETLYNAANLEEAVQQAQRITAAHGLVLLSPGAPSFPYFRNFQERGRAFAQYCGFDLPDSEADFDGQAEPKELTE